MVAGGPAASILLTIVCAAICARSGNEVSPWIGSLFWTGLFMAANTIFPVSSGVKRSDGMLLWQFVHDSRQTRLWAAMAGLHAEDANGVRPRDLNPAWFLEMLKADAFDADYPSVHLSAYYRRWDEGEEALALVHLENALAGSGRADKATVYGLYLEAACASALICKRPAQARAWYERAGKLRKIKQPSGIVDAGIAMAEGRLEDALPHWELARKRISRLDSGVFLFLREKWAGFEATCQAGTSGDAPAP